MVFSAEYLFWKQITTTENHFVVLNSFHQRRALTVTQFYCEQTAIGLVFIAITSNIQQTITNVES